MSLLRSAENRGTRGASVTGASKGHPKCPHCGGEHWGQRFDDCPYVRLLSDPSASEEQRLNAASWLTGLGGSGNQPGQDAPRAAGRSNP